MSTTEQHGYDSLITVGVGCLSEMTITFFAKIKLLIFFIAYLKHGFFKTLLADHKIAFWEFTSRGFYLRNMIFTQICFISVLDN